MIHYDIPRLRELRFICTFKIELHECRGTCIPRNLKSMSFLHKIKSHWPLLETPDAEPLEDFGTMGRKEDPPEPVSPSGAGNEVILWRISPSHHTRWWCPRAIAKLANRTPITMIVVGDISIVNGVYQEIHNWGGSMGESPNGWIL